MSFRRPDISKFAMVSRIALRNLYTHRRSSNIVGAIIGFGTFLVVVGTSFLDSIEASMVKSVVSSVSGHIQIYSQDAKDEFSLFRSGIEGDGDLGNIPNFAKIRHVLEADPKIRAVVPMGVARATVSAGNNIDKVVESLRSELEKENWSGVESLKTQVLSIAAELEVELQNSLSLLDDKSKTQEGLNDIARLKTKSFWETLKNDDKAKSEDALVFIESRIAPLASEGRLYFLRNLGTDLQRFPKHFDRFEIVEGQNVPPGKRGFLFAKRNYEKWIKNRVARQLDRIYAGVLDKGLTIADDPELRDMAKRLPRQYQRISFQLSSLDAEDLKNQLEKYLSQQGDLNLLLQSFLSVDDSTILERHTWFYQNIAPRIKLYAIDIGDIIPMRTFTQSGYLTTVPVKVYGTFQFKGLEASELAGAQNLVDLVTFRMMYGVMSKSQRDELSAIKAEVNALNVSQDSIEDTLFGESNSPAELTAIDTIDSQIFANENFEAGFERGEIKDMNFDPQTIDDGLAVHAAVILEDGVEISDGMMTIGELSSAQNLNIQAIDWQSASGLVGQFIVVVRIVLYVAIFIIFLVAIVIINNSMVMATLDRTPEIGTLRAIGAQRSFVVQLFLLEILSLGLVAGLFGTLLGAATIGIAGVFGIPAQNDIMVFLFSGPRLFPSVGVSNMVLGLVVVLLVSLLSTFYPAFLATKVQPIVAMSTKE